MQTVTIPTLSTERLTLRAPQAIEFATYRDFMISPRARFIGSFDVAAAWREFAAGMGHWALFGYGPLHVVRDEDGALVGEVGILNHDEYPEVELGWTLFDGFEGHGYAAEAAYALRAWAFAEHKFPSLVSYIDGENAASIAVAKRLGAVEDTGAQKTDPEDVVYRHSGRGRLQ
ncbi:MAG: GNAT family N-acetyltransferase [Pseudomonadota bacterium]